VVDLAVLGICVVFSLLSLSPSLSLSLCNSAALPSGEERELIGHTCRLLHRRLYLLKRSSREHSNWWGERRRRFAFQSVVY